MKTKYYFNDLTRIIDVKGVRVIANVENKTVIGMDDEGKKLLFKLSTELIDQDHLEGEEREVFDTLLEFDMISNKEYDKTRHQKIELISAYVHVTNHCNLNCLGCYSLDDNRNKACDPTFDQLKRILSELHRLGANNVVVSGGEPFLRKDIYEILDYAKNQLEYEQISLITNGTVKIDYDRLVGVVDEITVSVDGYSEECGSFIRDEGIFNKIMNTVKSLKEANISVSMLPTVHKKNYDKIEEYLELSALMEVPINFSVLSVCNTPTFDGYILETEQLRELSKSMIKIGGAINDSAIGGSIEAGLNCGAGQIIVSVDAGGNVYPCHMLHEKEFLMGNVLRENLDTILESSSIVKEFKETNADTIEDCKGCEYKYFCSTGCRARSYFQNGNIHRKDSYCELSRYFFDDLMSNVVV